MEVSVFGYADIGSQPGQPLTYLGRELDSAGILNTVYARGIEKSVEYNVSKPIIGGRKIPRALSGIGRLSSGFPDRYVSETIFDYFSSVLAKNDFADLHFHYQPGLIRTVESNTASKTRVIVRGPTELVSSSLKRRINEAERAGIELSTELCSHRRAEHRRQTLSKADHIIALSNFVKRSYVQAGIDKKKISVIPQGVNVDDYPEKCEPKSGEFSAIYVGSINLLKGIRYLLIAWDKLELDNSKLLLCGNISDNIKKVIENPPKDVVMPGHVDPREYLSEANVFVFPSLSEGFPKAPLEAMAAGLPVIVTTNSGINDVITDGEEGFVIPPRDPELLANKIRYLKNNPEICKRMGDSAIETAERYSWKRHSNRVVDVIRDLSHTE
ncbi:glycosyltransferase [Natronomonas marina]|uniref:glycosyltransferase n=1 Tax=Natronomonas marina TaxID=2961939 RepID=UPI0020C9F785|nr:glycosyltransferase [Natronomonas marina]